MLIYRSKLSGVSFKLCPMEESKSALIKTWFNSPVLGLETISFAKQTPFDTPSACCEELC